MAINFIDIDSGRKLQRVRVLKQWITAVVERENRVVGDVSIAFCSDSYIQQKNVEYLNHNYATDILTFSYNQDEIISGDLLISTDTIQSNAKEYGVSYSEELHRVIIHGMLHLIGYDDMCDADQDVMTRMEDSSLELLANMIK